MFAIFFQIRGYLKSGTGNCTSQDRLQLQIWQLLNKKTCFPLLYKMGHYFLDTQYIGTMGTTGVNRTLLTGLIALPID